MSKHVVQDPIGTINRMDEFKKLTKKSEKSLKKIVLLRKKLIKVSPFLLKVCAGLILFIQSQNGDKSVVR